MDDSASSLASQASGTTRPVIAPIEPGAPPDPPLRNEPDDGPEILGSTMRSHPRGAISPNEPIYERGKSSGPVQEIWAGSPRTSPSPSASVDLAHLRPRPRTRFVHPRPTSPEPQAEGGYPRPPTPRADADVIVTLNHRSGVTRRAGAPRIAIQESPIQRDDGRRWGRRRCSLRGRPVVRHAHRGTACLPSAQPARSDGPARTPIRSPAADGPARYAGCGSPTLSGS
jgi:hypothetical protein